MENFQLDKNLENDCHVLGALDFSTLLLMDNSLVPWFILVPRTDVTELHELGNDEQSVLLGEINLVSGFIRDVFNPDKLNVAAIGNIVKQLHVHVIGRSQSDYCWPGVVWGREEKQPYSDEELGKITSKLADKLSQSLKTL